MAVRPYSWDGLRRLSLARQFPRLRGRGVEAVARTVHRTGPIQSQTARSTFLGVAARLPGVDRDAVVAAFETARLVRGSSIRGTVHTSTPEHHRLLDVATRLGRRRLWQRTLRLERHSVEEVHRVVERLASGDWRPAEELRERLLDWLRRHESAAAAEAMEDQMGRYLAIGHSALVRRPLRGGWDGQALAGYRVVDEVVAEDAEQRSRWLADPAAAVAALVRLHLSCYGPATRADVAWWTGLGLRQVDAALERLGGGLVRRAGPDGGDFWDLAEGTPRPVSDVGPRLLPEFDAVLVGYHPRARDRFVRPDHAAVLWSRANGLILPPVLHHGRVVGHWRLEGAGRRRRVKVACFTGCARPAESELAGPVGALSAVLAVEITDLAVGRHED